MDAIARNLAVVDAHIRDEARDPSLVMDLYTDDIVLEMPTRGLTLTSKPAIEANYRAMFGAIAEVEIAPGTRFATEDHVVDDCTVRFRLVGEGMANAPLPVGSRVELRLLHLFAMRDGRIARETVYEGWRRIG
ncbi:nuclear transport factor 2 family protein [Neoroseomonas soli]|nr:nuclear transport factor 2 family protein [Neoroseomonas soli]